MTTYVCPECAYVYDEAKGDAHEGFPAGTDWQDIPDSFFCPNCNVRDKLDFVQQAQSSENETGIPARKAG
jgi:rubredoxin